MVKNKYQRRYSDYTEHVSRRATVSLTQSELRNEIKRLIYKTKRENYAETSV